MGGDVQAVRDELEALFHHHPPDPPARIPDINVELWIDDRQISSSRPPEYVKGQGLIKFWFDVPSKPTNDLRLRIKIEAPYQETSGHYVIVFGEPTASPRVTFRPGDFASPESVLLLHFIQGGHRPDARCQRHRRHVPPSGRKTMDLAAKRTAVSLEGHQADRHSWCERRRGRDANPATLCAPEKAQRGWQFPVKSHSAAVVY
jgi:hypothetical protein